MYPTFRWALSFGVFGGRCPIAGLLSPFRVAMITRYFHHEPSPVYPSEKPINNQNIK
jgi:hypothetical protein